MPEFLIAIHHPQNFNGELSEDATIHRAIDDLNDEMEAAGIRKFAKGLRPIHEAKSLVARPNGGVLVTNGPYLDTKEYVGGFWIIEAESMEKAVEWGRKAVAACRTQVEVRQFH